MVRVDKSKSDLPVSLYIAQDKSDPLFGSANQLTHKRRTELIQKSAYLDLNIYNSRYKTKDIKSALMIIYKGRCAFCEQNARPFHVEHFRPKSIYFWLAYSWDNLLLACASCNSHKLDKFSTVGKRSVFTDLDYNRIHSLSSVYNASEIPLLLNPETDSLKNVFSFEENGKIISSDVRGNYTIETCDLDRIYLRDDRHKIIKKLKRGLLSIAIKEKTEEERLKKVSVLQDELVDSINEGDDEFIAFRRFLLIHWFDDIVNEVFNTN